MTESVPPPAHQTASVRIDHESAVAYASAVARERAREFGLGTMAERAAVVTSELASNICKHTTGGSILVGSTAPPGGLQVWAVDNGPGVPDIHRCLVDGYTTTGTLGTGLGAARRMATDFAAWSRQGMGTVVSARFHLEPPSWAASRVDAAGMCLPAREVGISGDAYALAGATLLVVDGLGHGPAAAAAAGAAIAAFQDRSRLPLPTLLEQLHRVLRSTRGAAAAVLRLQPDRVDFCGVGNVGGAVLGNGRPRARLVGQPGTLGARIPTIQERQQPLTAGDTLVVHTDGIAGHWWQHADSELLYQPPATLAGILTGHHRRPHDDATVVVLRPRQARHAPD